MARTFKQMKKGDYFGHLNEPGKGVFKKTGTHTFENCKTGEELDIRKTNWRDCYDSDFGMFCLAEVEITISKITWRPEW